MKQMNNKDPKVKELTLLKERIEKMKKLYGLYKQFQEQEDTQGQPIVVVPVAEELPSPSSLPEVKPTPQKGDPVKAR